MAVCLCVCMNNCANCANPYLLRILILAQFRFDLDMPIYVNMVRDPVERVISWYYYVRYFIHNISPI